jgi:hypothetical protein
VKRTAVLSVILAVGACSRTPAPGAGELRVTPLGGEVNLLQGGESSLLEEASTVDAGVNVTTGVDGRARIQLPSGQTMELAPDTNLRVDSDAYEVSDGSVLLRTAEPMMVQAGGAQIETTEGTFRIDRASSVRLATYEGQASVVGSNVEPVTALRQVTVGQGGKIYGGIAPLDVRRNDLWDIEILGAAIELGSDLAELERGLSRQLPPNREAEAVSDVMQRTFSEREIDSAITLLGSAARAVVASVIAQEAARIDGVTVSLRAIFSQVVNLQRFATNWIIVVAEWELARAALAVTQQVRSFAASIAESVAPPQAPSSGGSAQVGSRQPGPGGEAPPEANPGNTPPGNNNNTDDESSPPPAPDAEEEKDDSAPPPCGSTVECAVDDVLGGDTPNTPSMSG